MDRDRAQQIYDEISGYEVKLEHDPGSLGPRYLNDIICLCRNHINAVSRFVMEVHREKHDLTSALTAEEAAYQVESDDLLANDERVRRLPNIEDRKATVAVLLRDRARRINELRAEIQNLDFVDKAVRHRHKELKDTMTEIRTQRSLMRDEIDTKSFYGDETTEVRKSKGDPVLGSSVGIDEEELNQLMSGALPQRPAPCPPTGTECPVCQQAQFHTPNGGVSCPDGHGFGSTSDRPPPEVKAEPLPELSPAAKGFYNPPVAVIQCQESPEPEMPAPPLGKPQEPSVADLDLAAIDRFLDDPVPTVPPKASEPTDAELESILANI
jgi:hypothetical protein